MARREFPADQDTFESVLIVVPGVLAERMETVKVAEVCRVISDRRTGEVSLRIGKTTLVISGRNCQGLSEALAEHVDHLGPAADFMVSERVDE